MSLLKNHDPVIQNNPKTISSYYIREKANISKADISKTRQLTPKRVEKIDK